MDEGGEVLCYSSVTLPVVYLFLLHNLRTISYTSLFYSLSYSWFLLSFSLSLSYRVADTVARSLSGRGDTFGKVKGRWRVACSMSRKLSYWVGCRSNRDLKRRILLTWRENFSGQNVRSLTSSECLIFLFFFLCSLVVLRYKQD